MTERWVVIDEDVPLDGATAIAAFSGEPLIHDLIGCIVAALDQPADGGSQRLATDAARTREPTA